MSSTTRPSTKPNTKPESESKARAGGSKDVNMTDVLMPPEAPEGYKAGEEPTYGRDKFTRFELELEFVQCLANPNYLCHLANATNPPYFTNPAFINYLAYLQYWSQPAYVKYLHYPGATLKNLELLQLADFRRDVGRPDVVARMIAEGIAQGKKGPNWKGKEKEDIREPTETETEGGEEDEEVQGESVNAQ